MKKFILILAAFCTAAVSAISLSACAYPKNNGRDTENNQYELLNEMLALNYSFVKLTVTDTFDSGLSLVSEYGIDYTGSNITVNYSVERFSSVSLESPADAIKTTYTGAAVIENGNVVISDGSTVIISADIAERGMNFKKEYFSNADLAGIYLKADVTDASGFMGYKLACTDMRVDAEFLEIFYSLKITYCTESGNSVQLLYEFTP